MINPSIVLAFLSFVFGVGSLFVEPKNIKNPQKKSNAFWLFGIILLLIFGFSIWSIIKSEEDSQEQTATLKKIDDQTQLLSIQITRTVETIIEQSDLDIDLSDVKTASSNVLTFLQSDTMRRLPVPSSEEKKRIIVFSTDPDLTIDKSVSAEWEVQLAKKELNL